MAQSVPEKMREDMSRFSMVPEDGRILAAVSGGADSVCLFLALRELGYDVSVVHVEHGIRGEESLEDCEYVRELCREYQAELRVIFVDAPKASREGAMSLEEAARQERYRALWQAAGEMGIRCIATAHHRMDQAETVLWNLIRGSSVGGLGGIRPVRREDGMTLIRPLIGCGRDEIEEYLRQRGVLWRTDRTNNDLQITRNAIRMKVLPSLESLNPGAVRHIVSAADDLRDVEAYLEEKTEETFRKVILEIGPLRNVPGSDGGTISEEAVSAGAISEEIASGKAVSAGAISEGTASGEAVFLTADRDVLAACPRVIRLRVLRRMIGLCCGGLKDITRRHVEALDKLCCGNCGLRASLPGNAEAVSEAGILRLTSMGGETAIQGSFSDGFSGDMTGEAVLTENGVYTAETGGSKITLQVEFITWGGGEVPKNKFTKYLAYDTITPNVTLRTRRPGDYLVVNSQGGRRKLKDYLIDEKVPRGRRDDIWLIAQGSHILWVIGMRISEDAKVQKGSEAICIRVTSGVEPDYC